MKTKSIIRQIKKVNDRRVPAAAAAGNRLKSVCIIEMNEDKFDRKKLKKLASILGVKEKDVQFRSFVKQKNKEGKSNPELFSPKDIGWNGVFKTAGLKDLRSTMFDVVISYYTEEHIILSTVSSLGPARFKVGLGTDRYQVYDLSLEIKTGETDVFLTELEKYLKILKIIQ